ncbi:hypothetical protein WJX72_003531 [[Myrmecia] bisecta]|uniref:Uncharacterized protein n=1 Tax=[Myrmecia] bisecta TaxID=41462 RepID=A0AAW1Q5D6_9CHLO
MNARVLIPLLALMAGQAMAQAPVLYVYTGPRDFALIEQSSPALTVVVNPNNTTDALLPGEPGVGAYFAYSAGLYLPAGPNITDNKVNTTGQLVGKSTGVCNYVAPNGEQQCLITLQFNGAYFPNGNATDGTPAGTFAITGCTGPCFGLTGTDGQRAISDTIFGHSIHLQDY